VHGRLRFRDRTDAGRRLAERLRHLAATSGTNPEPVVVLGLPRGGVPVAAEVAKVLRAPLDVILVRKLGVPFQPELAMGAIGEGSVTLLNERVLEQIGISREAVTAVEARERAKLERRAHLYRAHRGDSGPNLTDLASRTAVVVDDGIATGSTARAACQVARALGARRVVLAVPVAPPGWTERLADAADELVCVGTPRGFFAIGQFYDDFSQTTDEEVMACLARAEGA
jgi:putative phosphoribosyl transferase